MTIKCTSSGCHFDGHGSLLVQYKAHCPMQHVQGYSGSHWTPPSSDFLLCIALEATRATGKERMMNKYTYFAGHFDGHGYSLVHNRMQRLMEEVQDFTRSHWMPPLGEYYV
jgi:hypothetical protein